MFYSIKHLPKLLPCILSWCLSLNFVMTDPCCAFSLMSFQPAKPGKEAREHGSMLRGYPPLLMHLEIYYSILSLKPTCQTLFHRLT
jgi:hypothetical protein